ncbi:DnaJ family domain-containing protein [Desulfobaculum bizertense]|uniref:DnaJ homologue subfamily C member 28 conserved domain-containing protein n=1 Tax=Desulfobaculum bizertense DSM 18034 TaxID=1121442 RepID=A0A1T4WZU9_9BACT|nr:DnaJ family domain-containing protein [Desulfobaculum bizertense]SKA82836.1 protein of unknown function [Desulfobaculum bizertense DSM 18034]
MGIFGILDDLAEERIKAAIDKGDFQNLEGQGKPLELEDDSLIPEDLRMSYKILRNSGHVPPEVQADKDIRTAVDLLNHCKDEKSRYRQMQKLNYLLMKTGLGSKRSFSSENEYYEKILDRIDIIPED